MIEIAVSQSRRARVWVGVLPDAEYTPSSWLTKTLPATHLRAEGALRVAVETYIPHGARCCSALLGCTFRPVCGASLHLRVGVLDGTAVYSASMVARLDTVRIGHPDEMAEGVIAGLSLPTGGVAGDLTVQHAAYGMVGSSYGTFGEVAKILSRILLLPVLCSKTLFPFASNPHGNATPAQRPSANERK